MSRTDSSRPNAVTSVQVLPSSRLFEFGHRRCPQRGGRSLARPPDFAQRVPCRHCSTCHLQHACGFDRNPQESTGSVYQARRLVLQGGVIVRARLQLAWSSAARALRAMEGRRGPCDRAAARLSHPPRSPSLLFAGYTADNSAREWAWGQFSTQAKDCVATVTAPACSGCWMGTMNGLVSANVDVYEIANVGHATRADISNSGPSSHSSAPQPAIR